MINAYSDLKGIVKNRKQAGVPPYGSTPVY